MTLTSGLRIPSRGAELIVRKVEPFDLDQIDLLPIDDQTLLHIRKKWWDSWCNRSAEQFLVIYDQEKLIGLVVASVESDRIRIEDVFTYRAYIVRDIWSRDGFPLNSSRG